VNFGACVSTLRGPRGIARRVDVNAFVVHSACAPFELADFAVDPLRSTAAERAEVAKYVEAWAACFSRDRICEALVAHILQNDAAARNANTVWAEGRKQGLWGNASGASPHPSATSAPSPLDLAAGEDASSFQEFCYGMDEDCEMVFEMANAACFFVHIGVLKAGGG
jgi:hypothetical protein